MRDDEKLNARYSRLVSSSAALHGIQRGGKGDVHATKDLQKRLNALSEGRAPGEEREYEERLSRLLSRGDENSTVDDLEVRFARLGGASTGATRSPTYDVPPDSSEEWKDLDDQLIDALEGLQEDESTMDSSGISLTSSIGHTTEYPPRFRQRLHEIEGAAATAIAQATSVSAMHDTELDGGQIEARALETFLGEEAKAGGGGRGESQGDGTSSIKLTEEEQRLFDMVTEEVRLEGRGITSPQSSPVSSGKHEFWLPIAPTAPPVITRPGKTGGRGRRPTESDAVDDAAAARLIAQQAMDEARLGVADRASRTKPSCPYPRRGDGSGKDDYDSSEDEGAGWCGICSEDAVFRCLGCEAEFGQPGGEPELFCARCFNKEHRSDPEMRVHRALGLSRARGVDSEVGGGGGPGEVRWRR